MTTIPLNIEHTLPFVKLQCLGEFTLGKFPIKNKYMMDQETLLLCVSEYGLSVHEAKTGIPFTRGCFTVLCETFDISTCRVILNNTDEEMFIKRLQILEAVGFDRGRVASVRPR